MCPEIPAFIALEADTRGGWPVGDLEFDVYADLRHLLLEHRGRIHVGANVVDDENQLFTFVARPGQRGLGPRHVLLEQLAIRVVGRPAIDPALVHLVDVRVGHSHDFFRVQPLLHSAAEVQVRTRPLGHVELENLGSEGQDLDDLEVRVAGQPFGRRAVGGLVERDLPGGQSGVARAGFGHEAEGDAVHIGNLGSGKTVTFPVGWIRPVLLEARQLDMAVRPEFDKLEGAGADRRRLAHLLGGFLGWHDGDRRTGTRKIAQEGGLHRLELDRHLVRPGGGHRVDRCHQGGRRAGLAVTLQRGHHVGRCHVLAVVKLDALAQREHIGDAVGRNAHASGQIGHRSGILVARIEGFEHVQVDVARHLGRGGVRIERRRCLGHGDHHVPALLLCHCRNSCPQRERGGQCELEKFQFHGDRSPSVNGWI